MYGSAYNIDGSIIELGTISYFFNSNGRLRISTLYIDSDDIRLHYDDTNYTWITLKDYIKDIVQELIQWIINIKQIFL